MVKKWRHLICWLVMWAAPLTPHLLKWKCSTERHRVQAQVDLPKQREIGLLQRELEAQEILNGGFERYFMNIYEVDGIFTVVRQPFSCPNNGRLDLSLRVFLFIILFQSLWEVGGGPLCQSHSATDFIIKAVRMSHIDSVCWLVLSDRVFPQNNNNEVKRNDVSILVLFFSCYTHQAESLRWGGIGYQLCALTSFCTPKSWFMWSECSCIIQSFLLL